MSLTFGGASDHNVNVGSGASLDSLANLTYLAWIHPTSVAALGALFSKGVTTGGGSRRNIFVTATTARLQAAVDCATTDATASSADNVVVANVWQIVGMTYEDAVKGIKLYRGDLTTLIAETSYQAGNPVAGSGAAGNNDTRDMFLGASSVPDGSFAGLIGPIAVFNRVLTLAEMREWQVNPSGMISGCVGLWWFGDNGTGTQEDRSGNSNHGTVTGATYSEDPPLRRAREVLSQAVQRAATW